MPNPFIYRRPLIDGSQFYGRDLLLEEVLDLVAGGQSCAIIGERRIGKTSLLHSLTDPALWEAHGWDERGSDLQVEDLHCIELDFLSLHAAEPEQLWGEILAGAKFSALKTIGGSPIDHRAPFASVRSEIARLIQRGQKVVLLCDEMQYAVENPRFDGAVFGALRALASAGAVFVITSRMSLLALEQYRDEETRRKVLTSPFFNLFVELEMGWLDDAEVAEVLAGNLDETPVRFDAEDLVFLRKKAGRHPYLVQLVASHLYDARRRASESSAAFPRNYRAALSPRMLVEADQLFRSWWRDAGPAEREVLRSLASGEPLKDSSELAATPKRGWLRISSAGVKLNTELFSEWLSKHVDQFEETKQIGRYSILEEFGYGDAVHVFRAWDERLQRMVAIKSFREDVREDPSRAMELLDRARGLAALDHPNLSKIHDIDAESGLIIEELAVGGSLREALADLSVEAVRIRFAAAALQIGDALAAVHGAGIVFGDLRAENVLFLRSPPTNGPWPRVVLTAFGGLRHEVWKQGPESSSLKLLANRAPETLAGESGDETADIYSAGTILYEMHYGKRLPIGGLAARSVDPSPLEALIEKCLERDRSQRFQDGRELLKALKTWENSQK